MTLVSSMTRKVAFGRNSLLFYVLVLASFSWVPVQSFQSSKLSACYCSRRARFVLPRWGRTYGKPSSACLALSIQEEEEGAGGSPQPLPQDDSDLFSCLSDYACEGDVLLCPHPDLTAEDVVHACLDSLLNNNDPRANAGLEVCFNFSSDRCRAALGGNLEKFIAYAANPTFGAMINAREWKKISVGPIIQGTPTRGAMQTILVGVIPRSGRERRFLWTLQKERRPPRSGCWLVHEVIFTENAFSMTL